MLRWILACESIGEDHGSETDCSADAGEAIDQFAFSSRSVSLCSSLVPGAESESKSTVLHIDSALEWMHVSAGQVIYRQGDEADSFYIVSSSFPIPQS